MKTQKIISKTTKIFATTLLLASSFSGAVSAWGPERTTYTNESPADYATFNSITNNVAVGDERNFVRVKELGTSDPYRDEIEVTPGKEYEVYIYYHNNAGSDTNESGYGIATATMVSSGYPTVLNAGDRGMVSGIITWSYVNPADDSINEGKVWDEAYLTSSTDGVTLKFKAASAIIHNSGDSNGSILPLALFSRAGTPIGFYDLAGMVPGCAEYSGHITYTLIAEKNDDCTTNPEAPECKDCDNNPELPECQEVVDCTTNPEAPECQEKTCATNPEMEGCSELPNTGPLEIVMAIIIIAGIGGGGYYLYRTKRTLKTAEKVVKGEDETQKLAKTEQQPEGLAQTEKKEQPKEDTPKTE